MQLLLFLLSRTQKSIQPSCRARCSLPQANSQRAPEPGAAPPDYDIFDAVGDLLDGADDQLLALVECRLHDAFQQSGVCAFAGLLDGVAELNGTLGIGGGAPALFEGMIQQVAVVIRVCDEINRTPPLEDKKHLSHEPFDEVLKQPEDTAVEATRIPFFGECGDLVWREREVVERGH